MSRLIDADKIGLTDFEIIMCNGDYKEALKMLLEKINNQPTVKAIPIERLEQIRAEIKQLPHQHIFKHVGNYSLLDMVIEIIDKYRKEI